MTIAEVSKKYDITQDTLRYYERIGLLPEVPRTKSGIRNFDEQSCKWVEFIKCMRSAGMTIEILLDYMTLFKQGKETVSERKNLLIGQRQVLENKKKEIQNTIKRLDHKIELYKEIEHCKNSLTRMVGLYII